MEIEEPLTNKISEIPFSSHRNIASTSQIRSERNGDPISLFYDELRDLREEFKGEILGIKQSVG